MERTHVKEALLAVLTQVQATSGLECPPLGDAVRPIEDLPSFDSKVWPVALGLVGKKLGVSVPLDVNVFREEQTKVPFNIEETVTAIIKAIQQKAAQANAVSSA
ncbi:MAG: hypothetical protein WAQ05_26880 [Rubrivivax sp.]